MYPNSIYFGLKVVPFCRYFGAKVYTVNGYMDPIVGLSLLGGSWEVSGVISRVTVIITHIRGLITPRITTHQPPSKGPE